MDEVSLQQTLNSLDPSTALRVICAYLQNQPAVALGVVQYIIPDVTYAPTKAFSEGRCVGTISMINAAAEYGLIDCPHIFQKYGQQVTVLVDQYAGFKQGDVVSFACFLDRETKPQAFDLQTHRQELPQLPVLPQVPQMPVQDALAQMPVQDALAPIGMQNSWGDPSAASYDTDAQNGMAGEKRRPKPLAMGGNFAPPGSLNLGPNIQILQPEAIGTAATLGGFVTPANVGQSNSFPMNNQSGLSGLVQAKTTKVGIPPNGLKNKLCDFFTQGICRNGDMCGYAHGQEQLGTPIAAARIAQVQATDPGMSAGEGLQNLGLSSPSSAPQIMSGDPSSDPHAGKRYQGVILSYDQAKGFGFIQCPEIHAIYGKDVFLHSFRIGNHKPGDQVSFNIYLNRQGQPQAKDLLDLGAMGMIPNQGLGNESVPMTSPAYDALGSPGTSGSEYYNYDALANDDAKRARFS